MKSLLMLTLIFVAPLSMAATVGVVDSGTDFEHTDLVANQWNNPGETAGNRIDDDGNGKVDDINGWNFAHGYGKVFVRRHLNDIDPIVYPLFEYIAKIQAGTINAEEMQFVRDNLIELPEQQRAERIAMLNYFGQYSHGTHVAGIVVGQSPQAQVMAARLFPDDVPPARRFGLMSTDNQPQGIIDWLYYLLAQVSNATFVEISNYLAETKMDVANLSLGIPLHVIARQMLAIRGNSNPTEEQLQAEVQRLFAQYEPQGRQWIESAPETLFVIAAGNDGHSNDLLPTFPANVKTSNAITVAATKGFNEIAEFSNFGDQSVDIAAPGVAIDSSVPSLDRQTRLPMSGTSMAAPIVAGIAAEVVDANPSLSSDQVRQILMETVDVKEWLSDKVSSSGIANSARAVLAAQLARDGSIEEATASARSQVPDQVDEPTMLQITSDTGPVPAYIRNFVF